MNSDLMYEKKLSNWSCIQRERSWITPRSKIITFDCNFNKNKIEKVFFFLNFWCVFVCKLQSCFYIISVMKKC